MKSTGYSGVDKPLSIWYALEVRNTGQGNRPKLTCQPRPGLRTRIMVTGGPFNIFLDLSSQGY